MTFLWPNTKRISNLSLIFLFLIQSSLLLSLHDQMTKYMYYVLF